MFSETRLGVDARHSMLAGVNEIADAVRVTLGAQGRSAALDTSRDLSANHLVTNDGATIARRILPKDKFARLGAKYVKVAAEKTNDNAGDGTTTTILLTQAIIQEGIKAIGNGSDSILLRRGMQKALVDVVGHINDEAIKSEDVDTLSQTATISCRDAKVGRLIAETVKNAGQNGMITLEDSYAHETTSEKLEGIKLNGGRLNDLYINDAKTQQTVFNDVLVAVSLQTLTSAEEMGAIMEACVRAGKTEAIVFANGIEGMALTTSAINWNKNIKVMPVRVIAYGDLGEGLLKDVAAITGATFMDGTPGKTMADFTSQDFGNASKVVTDRHTTTVISKDEKLKQSRIKELQALIGTSTEFEKENLKERVARLESSMFMIKVGGVTDTDREELKTRIEDALNATRAAASDGVVAGGGSALYRAACVMYPEDNLRDDEKTGYNILLKACSAPIKQLAINSGVELSRDDYTKIRKQSNTIDFMTGDVVDAFESGIIDPVKVITESITNAATQAGLFITTETAVSVETPE